MARDETQAMSTERLAEIRQRADDPRNYYYSDGTDEDYLIERELLAEVERQRSELEAMAVGAARLDDRDNIICECRLAMPVGHCDGCWVLVAQRIAHTLPSGEVE